MGGREKKNYRKGFVLVASHLRYYNLFHLKCQLHPLCTLTQFYCCFIKPIHQIIAQKHFIFVNIDHYGYILDPNVRSRVEHKALSPLHFAAWFNAAKAVDVLLRNGANVESGSAFGQKPLHYAVSRASAELVMVS